MVVTWHMVFCTGIPNIRRPKYKYYNDGFYKGYGTIDWKPKLVTDSNGNISIKIAQPEIPITLFIEGIANDGSFIFEEKTISLN